MSMNRIMKILDMHYVPYYAMGGHVFADSMIGGTELFEEVEDVTDWSRQQLYGWLGY